MQVCGQSVLFYFFKVYGELKEVLRGDGGERGIFRFSVFRDIDVLVIEGSRGCYYVEF